MFSFRKKPSYFCALHNRRISGWITPDYQPVHHYAVAFCGEVPGRTFRCEDDGTSIEVKLTSAKLIVTFSPNSIVTLPYQREQLVSYRLPIYDAIESWDFFVSHTPICPMALKPGYRDGGQGVFYRIEDEEANRIKQERFRKDFSSLDWEEDEIPEDDFVLPPPSQPKSLDEETLWFCQACGVSNPYRFSVCQTCGALRIRTRTPEPMPRPPKPSQPETAPSFQAVPPAHDESDVPGPEETIWICSGCGTVNPMRLSACRCCGALRRRL